MFIKKIEASFTILKEKRSNNEHKSTSILFPKKHVENIKKETKYIPAKVRFQLVQRAAQYHI